MDIYAALDSSSWGEIWSDNKCIIGNPTIYSFTSCDPEQDNRNLVPYTANDVFYAPYKDIDVLCGDKKISLQEYQSMGFDVGSVVYDLVDSDTIKQWAQEQFGL